MLYLASFISMFLLAGMVPQAIGFYLTFLLVPFILYWRTELNSRTCQRLRHLSLGLFSLWVISPLSSIYNYIQTDTVEIPFKLLMRSHFSSAVGITSLCLFLFSMKDVFRRKTSSVSPRLELQAPPSSSLIKPFLQGLLLSSSILCMYLVFQQFSGMDFLGNAIPAARRMSGGLYRVTGFYSHPLTLAGVGLTLFGFIGTLLIQKEPVAKRWHLFIIFLMSAYFVLASGGRFATLIVVFFGMVILIVNYMQPQGKRVHRPAKKLLHVLVFLGLALAFCFFVLQKMGLLDRFSTLSTISNNPEFERFTFWQVHWQMFLDKPWLGQGLALLNSFKRVEYYDMLGFATMQNKYPAHNMVLEILSDVGVIGMGFIIFGVAEIWKAMRSLGYGSPHYVRALFVAFGLNFINGLTQNVFFDSSVMYIYLSLIMLIFWSDMRDGRTTV